MCEVEDNGDVMLRIEWELIFERVEVWVEWLVLIRKWMNEGEDGDYEFV